MTMSSSINATSFSESLPSIHPPLPSTSNVNEIPSLLQSLSGFEGKLFRELYQKGIVDAYGDLLPPFDQHRLPQLSHETIQRLKDTLFSPFSPLFESHPDIQKLSLPSLIEAFSQKLPPSLKMTSHSLAGSFLYHLLFEDSEFFSSLFNSLGIDENLLKEFANHSIAYSDIDIRSHLKSNFHLENRDLMQIKEAILNIAAYQLQPNPEYQIKNQLISNGFQTLCQVDTGFTRFLIVSFKGTPLEWILTEVLTRNSLFTLDNISLDIGAFLEKKNVSITFQSHSNSPLKSILHQLLGLIKAEDISSLTPHAWLKLVTLIVRGKTSAQEGLENALFERMKHVFLQLGKESLFLHEIRKWLKKHHENPFSAFAFLYHVQRLNHQRMEKTCLEKLWTDAWEPNEIWKNRKSPEGKIFAAMAAIIGRDGKGWPLLQSVLELASFLKVSFPSSNPYVKVTVTHHEFKSTLLRLQVGANYFLLEPRPDEALRSIRSFQMENPERWEFLKNKIETLFFLLDPPNAFPIPEDLDKQSDIDVQSIVATAEELLENDNPSIGHYLAFLCLMLSPSIGIRKKQEWAMLYCIPILSGIEENQNREKIQNQIESFLGKDRGSKHLNDIPDGGFIQEWILYFYRLGENEIAYKIWDKLFEKIGTPLTLELVPKICSQNPDHALRMLAFLGKKERFFEFPILTMQMIVESGKNLQKCTLKNIPEILYDRFLIYCTEIIPLLLPRILLPSDIKNQKTWRQALIWYSLKCLERKESSLACELIELGINKGLLLEGSQERKLGLKIWIEQLWISKSLPTKFSDTNVSEYTLDGIREYIFTPEQNILILLDLFNTDTKNQREIIYLFLEQTAQLKFFPDELRFKSLQMIIGLLESIPLFPLSFLFLKKKEIETLLPKLQRNEDPFLLRQRILIQYDLKGLKIENHEVNAHFWIETLQSWPLTQTQEWEEIYRLTLLAKKFGFLNFASLHATIVQLVFVLIKREGLSRPPTLEKQQNLISILNSLKICEHQWEHFFVFLKRILLQANHMNMNHEFTLFFEKLSFNQCSEDPAGRDALLRFCNDLLSLKQEALLSNWLLKTSLFKIGKNHSFVGTSFHAFFSKLAVQLLSHIKENLSSPSSKKSITILSQYVHHYIFLLNECPYTFWEDFFRCIHIHYPENLLPFYFKAFEAGLFEKDLSLKQTLFLNILKCTLSNNCLELIPFFNSEGIIRKIFNPCNLILRSQADAIILQGVLISLYQLLPEAQNVILKQARERFTQKIHETDILCCIPTIDFQSRIFIRQIWLQVELVLILALLHLEKKEEAKEHLSTVLKNAHFQIECVEAATLIHTLASPAYSDFQEEFQTLLEKKGSEMIPTFDYQKVLSFLATHPNPSYKIQGCRLLYDDLLAGSIPLKKESLPLIQTALQPLWDENNILAMQELETFFSLLFKIDFEGAITYDKNFIMELFIYLFPILLPRKDRESQRLLYHLFAQLAEEFSEIWYLLFEKKLVQKCFQAVARLILIKEDENMTVFCLWTARIWNRLTKMRQKNAILSIAPIESYRWKAVLIREIVHIFSESPPYYFQLGTFVSSFIKILKQNPEYYQRLEKQDRDDFDQFLEMIPAKIDKK